MPEKSVRATRTGEEVPALLRGRPAGIHQEPDRRLGADRTLAEQLPPPDHRWFVWADLDLEGTKVSGDPQLTQALGRDYFLEYLDRWPPATVT